MKIVIIGNGIAGITAARNIRKQSNHDILVISSETEHFFSRTALMYVYTGHMKFEHTKPYEDHFWDKNRIYLKKAQIKNISFSDKHLFTELDEIVSYDKLIICTGSKPKSLNIDGEKLKAVQGLYSKQDLDLMELNTKDIKDAVIIGGGLIGIEMAEMLLSRNIKVHFLIRKKNYWGSVLPEEEATMISKHIRAHHINLLPETEIDKIIGDENGRVTGIATKDGKTITCQFVGLTIGVQPNIDFLKNTDLKTEKGILVNEFLETNIQDVYALGDCAQFTEPKPLHPPIEQLWYTAKMQGEALAKTICAKKTEYNRGIWFNSAKFLDIEYQTYGLMFNKPLEDEETFYWQHPNKNIAFRANFKKESRSLTGLNFFGIRFRQTIADDWIRNGEHLSHCIANLNKGFFDPEFSANPHQQIIDTFNHSFPQLAIKTNKKKFLFF